LPVRTGFWPQVDLEGTEVLAHVADPGRLKELLFPGAKVYVSAAANPNRKTAFDLKLVQGQGVLVSVDSGVPNRIAKLALEAGGLALILPVTIASKLSPDTSAVGLIFYCKVKISRIAT